MAENHDLSRLEEQLYEYHPELKRDSEAVKSERRKRLFLQLRYSYPLVQMPAFDAISSLVNIKNLLNKCKDSVLDPHENCLEMAVASPSTSLMESSGDEFLIAQRPRRVPRKRKAGSSLFLNSEFVESNERREQDSPLSVSILIPQVVKGSDQMEISIDLGGIDTSQRLFGSRIDGLLRNRSISSSNTLEDLTVKERPSTSHKMKNLQMTSTASSTIQTDDNEKQEDDMLSRLISQVLVENNDPETLQATNVLDNINNNESSNYDAAVPTSIETLKVPKKKKVQRKPKKVPIEKGAPKKRGRKPKNKSNNHDGTLENVGLPKSDLAKYVELFSNTCNMAGSVTPAASSTMSQQLVTSTTHYLDSTEQQPITYYLEGDWENGGSCQLVQTESGPIDGAQEEFNMAELVNYIDNVGDAGNVIARVLDGSNTLPIMVQDSNSQSNLIVPPPAHISDVLLDLSKKSSMTFTSTATNVSHNSDEAVANHDILPLDLSLKSSTLNDTSIVFNTGLTAPVRLEAATEGVFVNNDYNSFEAALDMPLIDIQDNINAFMELTNSEIMTSANPTTTDTSLAVCDATIGENANICLPDFELNGILSENNACNTDCNIETQNGNTFNNEKNGSSVNSTNDIVHNPEHLKSIINTTVIMEDSSTNVGVREEIEKTINAIIAPKTDSVVPLEDTKESNLSTNTSAKENEEENNYEIDSTVKTNEHFEVEEREEKDERNSEIHAQDNKDATLDDIDICKIVGQNNYEANFDQNISTIEYCNNKALNECSNEDDIPNKKPSKLLNIEGSVDNNDELHGNLSDKSSIDYLFVDTESLPCNRLKYSYGAAITDNSSQHNIKIENDQDNCPGGKQNDIVGNEDVVCDLSTKDDHSKSIDLEEECQVHNVSVHLPMPQLTMMDNSSEEFSYDDDIGFESAEEKDLLTVTAEKHKLDEMLPKDQDDDGNPKGHDEIKYCYDSGDACNRSEILTKLPVMEIDASNVSDRAFGDKTKENTDFEIENITENEGKENSTFEDSAVFCSQKYADDSKEIETEPQNLKQSSNNLDQEGNLDVTEDNKFALKKQAEKCFPELTVQNSVQANEKVVIKEGNSLTSLSVLEMESKLDDVCLDFEEELEDDALSLATSYFNSSDDERLPEHNKSTIQTSLDNITTENDDVKVENMEKMTNNDILDNSTNATKMPIKREAVGMSNDIFRKFKIPKLSMTTATVKHSNPADTVVTAAPLPMVILPPNAFAKQSIKTEPDSNKPVGFEKITRTVQNVCAVTPLTLKHSTYASSTTATAPSSIDVVAPLIRGMLQLTPPIVGEDINEFKALNTGMAATHNSQHINCTRGEIAGNGGDGRNFGPPTIVVAKTFGVTCLPFLVGRCFTQTSCQFSHSFRDTEAVRNILSTLSEIDLNIAYKFAYNHEILFRQYMREFCKIYMERNNRFKLLNMVRDCERYTGGGEILLVLFHSLIQCGLNKVNACRQILNYSRDRSRTTIDALVDIILEADWTMFCDYIEKFSEVSSYHFRLNILHQMAPTILRANDQRMTSVFFKCLVNLDPKDLGLVQSSPILMQLLELIKNGQTNR